MRKATRQNLIPLLKQKNLDVCLEDTAEVTADLGPRELAGFYVDMVFSLTAMKFIQDQFWLSEQSSTRAIQFPPFIKKFFDSELEPLLFLQPTLEKATLEDIGRFQQNAYAIRGNVVALMAGKPYPENKIFAETALRLMSDLFEFESRLQLEKAEKGHELGFSLYRAFDTLDDVFRLNYAADSGSNQATTKERLYEGSGVGVQSSYTTLLMMLRYLKISTGAEFVDLGAGFGRVGFVLGLMRPDIRFRGYEFIADRVTAANLIAKNFGVDQHVCFQAQDLSALDFQIPVAEVYYMYDPFTDETYQHVLKQLVEIGAKKRITVVTKGNAKLQMQAAGQRGNWSVPQDFANGNFCLFRSTGRG